LRKGSYVPRFNLVREPEIDSLSTSVSVPFPPIRVVADEPVEELRTTVPKRLTWVAAIAFAGGAALMFAAIAVGSMLAKPGVRIPATHLEATAGTIWTPELETIWRPFTTSGTPLLIAFETRFFLRSGDLMIRDWHVNGQDGIKSSEGLMRFQQLFAAQRYSNRDYTDAGTPSALFFLTRLLSTRITNMSVKNSADLTAADLRDNNVVLLGKPGMDPDVEQVLSRGELVDPGGGKILNIHPGPGEQAEYHDQFDPVNPDRWALKYSVITVMPGSAGNKRILCLTAQGSEQPAALTWYMTNPDTVRDLVRRMGTTAPDFYQVLVRAEYKSKAVVKVDYITRRTLKVR
jgi:hypothetical protein